MPTISAIPTGSFAPDSPSRIVPERPPTSRRPSTENITAGSVGAIAAPRIHAIVQPKPNSECAASATSPAVRNVPTTPSTEIGTAERRKRRQPTFIPPSNRITISATTPTRSTVRIESRSPSAGKTSAATAAAIRKSAGAGTGKRSERRLASSASEKPTETTRTMVPKSPISLMRSSSRHRG